jgi:hypothetical protein
MLPFVSLALAANSSTGESARSFPSLMTRTRSETAVTSPRTWLEKRIVLPRAGPVLQEFAEHLAADVKRLHEDEETMNKARALLKAISQAENSNSPTEQKDAVTNR